MVSSKKPDPPSSRGPKRSAPRLIGAHMSIAGGYYKAVAAAGELGMTTCQLFTKNNNQWLGKEISTDDVQQFQRALDEHHVSHPISHSSYLINLASADEALWQKSVDAMVVELERAALLGISWVVVHPGASVLATEEQGIANVIRAIDAVHQRVRRGQAELLLENTAGQGSCLGWKFEQLAAIIAGARHADRLGVCFDTCHAFAAGYPLATASEYRRTFELFDQIVGLDRLRAFHLNDSVKPLGSRVDRHAHIGLGQIGLDGFRRLMGDQRFRLIPMYLETPKEDRDGEPWDAINLRTLRDFAGE